MKEKQGQEHSSDDTSELSNLTRGELNAFLTVSVIAGGLFMGLLVAVLPKVLAPRLELPDAVWMGLLFFGVGWIIFPALRANARLRRPRTARAWTWKRHLFGTLLGSIVGALVFAGIQVLW